MIHDDPANTLNKMQVFFPDKEAVRENVLRDFMKLNGVFSFKSDGLEVLFDFFYRDGSDANYMKFVMFSALFPHMSNLFLSDVSYTQECGK